MPVAKPGSAQPTIDAPRNSAAPARAPRRFDARRVYTAVLLLPGIYVVIRYLPTWTFTLLLIAGGSIALVELYRMTFGDRKNSLLIAIGLIATSLLIGQSHGILPLSDLLVLGTLTSVLALLFLREPIEYRFKDVTVTLFGVLYIGLTLGSLASTRALPSGEWLVLFVALVTWAGDTGAYYAGSLWGRHRIAPTVSPKKSVEGLAGGIVLAVSAALLAQTWFLSDLPVIDAIALGVLLTAAGLAGDLSESAIKRSVGVKDSGGILPGHGGMLDRLDSLLFTAPTFYYYVILVRGLSPLQ